MKRLTTLSLIAVAAAAMVAIPLDAQTRGNSRSSGGSGGGNSRSSGGSRPSSSVSAPASQSRSSSQSGNTKGLSSVNRSNNAAQRSAQPSASRQQPSSGRQSASKPQAAPNRQQPSAERRQQPRTGSNSSRSSSGNVSRNQPQNRQNPNQPGGSINRNQPQPGMSVNRDAPRTVRPREERPRNFEGGRQPSHVKMHPGPGRNMERIAPRHRDPMPFGRAVRFWDGGHHYFGYRVSYLPSRYVRTVHMGVTYYIVDGIYYRRYRGHYYVSRPPFGVLFDPVLDNLVYTVCNFAYYYDIYNTYRTIDDNARTIASQNATIAANNATIARQNEAIALNSERAAKSYLEADRLGLVQSYADAGMDYFYQDGVFFTKDKNGKYVTIVPPAGALVQELPDDYDVVTLDGEEYYKVDDTVYKLTIVDGTPYFEVLGQMTGNLSQKFDLYDTL